MRLRQPPPATITFALFAVTLCMITGCAANGSLKPVDIRCESRTDPMGIDVGRPRLSWTLLPTDDRLRGLRQNAYRVQVASSAAKLAAGQADVWDSGQVHSDQSVGVMYDGTPPYAGGPLASRTRYYWRVQVWDQDGRASEWSPPAFWAMAMRWKSEGSDWAGQWIGAPDAGNAAPLLRKEIQLRAKPVRATAYICGLGYYELRINGRKVGDHELDPGFTDYTEHALYVTYDVTEHFLAGGNAVGVILGNGWYHLPGGDLFGNNKARWTGTPRLLLNIDLDFADGSRQTLATDTGWKWSTGPIVFNSVRAGETIDAREDKPLWDRPGFDDRNWPSAVVLPAPAGRLTAQSHPPIRATETFTAVAITEPKPGVYVFDLGVNIVGHVRFQARGESGRKITLLHNEKLNADGTVDMNHCASHTAGRFQTEEFILRGRGEDVPPARRANPQLQQGQQDADKMSATHAGETPATQVFEPRFTYHGFRYVEVRGLTYKPALGDLVARWVHTDPEPAGEFACSDANISTLQKMIVRTQLNNLHSIPTDCPQREKMGWLQDGCVSEEEAICNFDMATFYTKWFHDMLDGQESCGFVPSLVPNCGWAGSGPNGSPSGFSDPWWGSAIIRTPWNLYLYYGDRHVLEARYPAMKAYVDYLGKYSHDLKIGWNLGDWLEEGTQNSAKRTPVELASTAAYFHSATLLSRIAVLVGKPDDARTYAELARRIGLKINERFLDTATGLYGADTQTAPAMALQLGFAPADKRAMVLEGLVKNIEHRGGHLSTGIVGTMYLPYALSENGRADLALKVLTAEGYPGYVHMIRSGASTIWEQWDGNNSLNHPALGCVGAWFYQALAGIRPDPEQPGFKTIILQPRTAGLTWVRASYRSVRGRIVSDWRISGGVFTWNIVVPANTEALVYVPAAQSAPVRESGKDAAQAEGVRYIGWLTGTALYEVASGKYCFTAPVPLAK